MAAPVFLWRDTSTAAAWNITVTAGGATLRFSSRGERPPLGEIDARAVSPNNRSPQPSTAHSWRPTPQTWAAICRNPSARIAIGSASIEIAISPDPVGAPIFYRDVPLMPSETEKGVIKPLAESAIPLINWRVREVGKDTSRTVMTGIHSCANCHSFSRDGKTLGMDVDGPLNDKGLYAVARVEPVTSIRNQDVIEWSTSRGKLGARIRVGFMSQLSPRGDTVITTINDQSEEQSDYQRRLLPKDLLESFFVANFTQYKFLQVFYPTRGTLAWYNRASGHLEPLRGADDPRYVHTSAVWTPDGESVIFARAAARDAYTSKRATFAGDPNETQIRYDLYRIPFNGGRGGKAEPIAGASENGMSNSFPKVSPDGRWIVWVQARNGLLMRPDSKLYIAPATGGAPRLMICNTPLMNSWHSFSPNGRWLVVSSKSRSPYTQMYLTHIDEAGNDSPPVWIENATAANRAVNLPEFVNMPGDALRKIAPRRSRSIA